MQYRLMLDDDFPNIKQPKKKGGRRKKLTHVYELPGGKKIRAQCVAKGQIRRKKMKAEHKPILNLGNRTDDRVLERATWNQPRNNAIGR